LVVQIELLIYADSLCNESRVHPDGAGYNSELREFIFPYDEVRQAASPDEALLEFLQSSYEAAADFGAWNRSELASWIF
jgi:hypothetical protein